MTVEILLVLLIAGGAVWLFVTEKFRADLVALIVLGMLSLHRLRPHRHSAEPAVLGAGGLLHPEVLAVLKTGSSRRDRSRSGRPKSPGRQPSASAARIERHPARKPDNLE